MVTRSLHAIAREISREWAKPYFGAVPYLEAMHELDSVKDRYFCDSGESIVAYFLSNAATFKGERAKAIKAELKALLKAA